MLSKSEPEENKSEQIETPMLSKSESSVDEAKEETQASEEVKTIEETSNNEPIEEEIEDEHVVLPYPERVPNVHKGTNYKHSYVMIGFIVIFIIFSILASFITNPI